MVDMTAPMAGKIVLITGGTGGIGKATAIGLAALGARVAITGRDRERAEAAAAEIRDATGNPLVDAFAADLSSQAEVRRLAAQVLDAYPRLDVLINNVGGFWATRHVTADGLERTFAVNHLAAFLLTNLLLDRLKASAPGESRHWCRPAPSRWDRSTSRTCRASASYSGQTAYNQSKLASVMFTYELARRLEGTGVTATVLHPGVVSTGFGAEDPSRIFTFIVPLVRPFMKTPQQGAATSIYLASSPKVEGVTGTYFAKGSRRPPTRPRTTSTPRRACGRSAPVSSASRRADPNRPPWLGGWPIGRPAIKSGRSAARHRGRAT